MAATATFNQREFRIRDDDGNETGATWLALENIDYDPAVDTNFRVRFSIDETTGSKAGGSLTWNLYYSLNSGTYAPVTGSTPIQFALSNYYADDADCTRQLTAQTGTFLTDNNGMKEDVGGVTNTTAAGDYFETEWCLQIDSSQVGTGNTIDLRIYNGSTALAAGYDNTPQFTVDNPQTHSGEVTLTGQSSLTCNGTVPGAPIVVIDHEEGIVAGDWDGTNGGSYVGVSAAAALAGTNYGLYASTDDNTSQYATIRPTRSTTGVVRLRFYMDISDVSQPTGSVYFMGMRDETNSDSQIFYAEMYYNGTDWYLILDVKENGGIDYSIQSNANAISPSTNGYVEIYITASDSGQSNGTAQMWINGVSQGSLSDVENDTQFVGWDYFYAGVFSIVSGTTGDYYIDEIVINEDGTEIGPVSGGATTHDGEVTFAGQSSLTAQPAAATHNGEVTFAGQSSLTCSGTVPASFLFDIDHENNDWSEWTGHSGANLTLSASAGLASTNYGLAGYVNDLGTHYAYLDFTASTSGVLRVRFYIDRNNLSMPTGTLYILRGNNSSDSTLFYVRFYYDGADYNLELVYYDDSAGTGTVSGVLGTGEHYVEFQIERATNGTSNDGTAEIWIDGSTQESVSNIDNYDLFDSWDYLSCGVYSIASGSTGTIYLDEIAGNDTGDAIGSLSGATTHNGEVTFAGQSSLTCTPTGALLFEMTHESNDFSEWTSTTGTDISVGTAGALAGTTYGLSALSDNGGGHYAYLDFTDNTTGIMRVRVYIDFNNISIPNGNTCYFVGMKSGGHPGDALAYLRVYNNSGQYVLQWQFYSDDTTTDAINSNVSGSTEYYIEMQLTRASNATASDGTAQLWVDGSSQGSVSNIDNYDRFDDWDFVEAGVWSIPENTTGTVYIDEVAGNDTGDEIGPLSSATTHSGEVTLAGQSSLTASVSVSHQTLSGEVTLAGQSALTMTGGTATTHSGEVVLAGESSLTAVSSVSHQTLSGEVTLAGESSLTAVPSVSHQTLSGEVALVGESSLTIFENVSHQTLSGEVALAGESSLTAVSSVSHQTLSGEVALAGESSLTATGGTATTHSGEVVLAGESSLTAVSSVSHQTLLGEVALAGESSLTVVSSVSHQTLSGEVALAGESSLTATSFAFSNLRVTVTHATWDGAVSIQGQSELIATPLGQTLSGEVTLAGQSALTVAESVTHQTLAGVLALTGESFLGTVGVTIMSVSGAGTPGANGNYEETGSHDSKPEYTKTDASGYKITWNQLAGRWYIWVDPTVYYYSNDDVATPDLCTTWNETNGELPLPEVNEGDNYGDLDSSVSHQTLLGEVTLAGQSAFTVVENVAHQTLLGELALVGQSALTAIPSVSHQTLLGEVTLTGESSLTVTSETTTTHSGEVALSGQSSLTAVSSVSHQTLSGEIALAGESSLTAVSSVSHQTLSGEIALAGQSSLTILESVTHQTLSGEVVLGGESSLTILENVSHQTLLGEVTLAGESTLTAVTSVAHQTLSGEVALAGESALTAIGETAGTHNGEVALIGESSLTAISSVAHQTLSGAVALAGESALTAVAYVGNQEFGEVIFTGQSTLTVIASVAHQTLSGAVNLIGESALTATGNASSLLNGEVALAGESALTASASVSHQTLSGEVALAGQSALTILENVVHQILSGEIALAGESTLTATVSVSHQTLSGVVAIAGQSSLTAVTNVAHQTLSGAIALAGESSLTAVPSVTHQVLSGEVSLQGQSTLTTVENVAHATLNGEVTFAGESSLTGLGAVAGTHNGVVSLIGQSALTAQNFVIGNLKTTVTHAVWDGEVTFAGQSSLTAVPTGETYNGEINLQGQSALTAVPSVAHTTWSGVLTLEGQSSLVTVAYRKVGGAIALSGQSALTVSESVSHQTLSGEVALAGESSLTALESVTHQTLSGEVALAGESSLTALENVAHQTLSGEVALAGESSLTGVPAVTHATWSGVLTLEGQSSLVVVTYRTLAGAVSLEGESSLTAVGGVAGIHNGAVSLEGQSSLTASASVAHQTISGEATLAGESELTIFESVTHQTHSGEVALAGESSLTGVPVVTHATWNGVLTLEGQSSLVTVAYRTLAGAVSLEGESSLTAVGGVAGTHNGAVSLEGWSSLITSVSVLHQTLSGEVTLAGESTLTASASVEEGLDDLTGQDVSTGAPTVDQPTLDSWVELLSQEILAGEPIVESATLTQTHALSAQDVTMGEPSVEPADLTGANISLRWIRNERMARRP